MPLAKKIKHKIQSQINKRKYPQFGRHNAPDWPHACTLLAYIASDYARQSNHQKVLVVGNRVDATSLQISLKAYSLTSDFIETQTLAPLQGLHFEEYCCILLAEQTAKQQYRLAKALTANPAAHTVPLEYIAIPLAENAELKTLDIYQDGDFVSPLHMQQGDIPTRIYQESLLHFEQKTDIRDYLDLWQILTEIKRRSLPGNIAEFGSYKGHSGYLMAQIMRHLKLDASLYMFDMFENFPAENIGVDRYWSNTHTVDFEEVKAKFSTIDSVQLVKGDFTQTLPQTETGPLSFVFIDCDSYRGTKYLLNTLWDTRVSVGGLVVLEDYGHAALLGNRLAAHEFFDERQDAHVFFSQFSGFYIAVKLAE